MLRTNDNVCLALSVFFVNRVRLGLSDCARSCHQNVVP